MKITDIAHYLPKRPQQSHKGDFGHALIIGGDHGMAGAVRLAGEAALRVGSGLVSVATRPEHLDVVCAERPELMCHGIAHGNQLQSLLERATVLAVGPGLGRGYWGKQIWHSLRNVTLPMLVDADGLYHLAEKPMQNSQWILTPHPGEAARLLGITTADIQADRMQAAIAIQKKFNGVCVLKGSNTIVVSFDGSSYVCKSGNPGMASGGMGDVLSGVITGLMAQHVKLTDAAQLGVFLHAEAGDLAANHGQRGMLALDLMPYLRQLVNPAAI